MKLPGILQDIADVAGEEVALKIAEAKGGTRVHFPGTKSLDQPTVGWLRELVGDETERVIVEAVGGPMGVNIDIPIGKQRIKKADIERRIAAGEGADKIALAVECHVRTVYRIKKRLKEKNGRPSKGQILTRKT